MGSLVSKKFYGAEFFQSGDDFTQGQSDDIGIAAFNPGDHEGADPLDGIGASFVKRLFGGNVTFNFLACQIFEEDFGGDPESFSFFPIARNIASMEMCISSPSTFTTSVAGVTVGCLTLLVATCTSGET